MLLVLRRNLPNTHRAFELKGSGIIAPIAFICSNWVIYWTGFRTNSYLFGIIAVGFILYALYYHFVARNPLSDFGWRHIAWLLPWFGGMWILSGISDIGDGAGLIGFWTGVVLVAIWSLIVMQIAVRTALSPAETEAIMARMENTA